MLIYIKLDFYTLLKMVQMNPITESSIETFAIEVLKSLGWEYVHSLALASGAKTAGGKVKDWYLSYTGNNITNKQEIQNAFS